MCTPLHARPSTCLRPVSSLPPVSLQKVYILTMARLWPHMKQCSCSKTTNKQMRQQLRRKSRKTLWCLEFTSEQRQTKCCWLLSTSEENEHECETHQWSEILHAFTWSIQHNKKCRHLADLRRPSDKPETTILAMSCSPLSKSAQYCKCCWSCKTCLNGLFWLDDVLASTVTKIETHQQKYPEVHH